MEFQAILSMWCFRLFYVVFPAVLCVFSGPSMWCFKLFPVVFRVMFQAVLCGGVSGCSIGCVRLFLCVFQADFPVCYRLLYVLFQPDCLVFQAVLCVVSG